MRRRKLVGTVVTPASLGNFQLTIWRYDIGDSLTRCASQMFGTSKAQRVLVASLVLRCFFMERALFWMHLVKGFKTVDFMSALKEFVRRWVCLRRLSAIQLGSDG
jgi:hypothetical protein